MWNVKGEDVREYNKWLKTANQKKETTPSEIYPRLQNSRNPTKNKSKRQKQIKTEKEEGLKEDSPKQ